MTLITQELHGVSAIQEDSTPSNFYALDDGLAVYVKPSSGWGRGSFQNTYFPRESENIRWLNVRCKLLTGADIATTDYKAVTQLYGILADGREELVAENIDQTISTTPTEREILFDVASSGSIPELAHLNLDGAVSGKSYLNLPLRYKFYDMIKLYPFQSQNGLILVNTWSRRLTLPVPISIPKWSDFSRAEICLICPNIYNYFPKFIHIFCHFRFVNCFIWIDEVKIRLL